MSADPPGLDPDQEDPTPIEEVPLKRLSPLTPIARSGIILVTVALVGGREVIQDGELAFVGFAAVGVIVVGLLFGLASWWRTTYRISDVELRIDTGVLSRRSRRVRLDRILEIGVNQPVIARLLGLAELKIETATQDSEVSLAFLPLAEAREVRRLLLDHRGAPSATGIPVGEGEDATADQQSRPRESERGRAEPVEILRVPLRWQLLGLAASGETLLLVPLGLLAIGLMAAGVPLGALGFSLATVIGAALSLGRKVVDWWNWRLSALPTGIQVEHGMLSVVTRTFNVQRLQGVRVTETATLRLLGMARLDLSVAGGATQGGGDDQDNKGVAIPVAPRDIVWRMAADLVAADPRAVPLLPPSPRARWFRWIGSSYLLFGLDRRLIVQRRGILNRRSDIVPLARVQSFTLSQGPLQRWAGVATVEADCPPGLVSIVGPHRDPAQARQLIEVGPALARAARLPDRPDQMVPVETVDQAGRPEAPM